MKRSVLFTKLNTFYGNHHDDEYYPMFIEALLDYLEELGAHLQITETEESGEEACLTKLKAE